MLFGCPFSDMMNEAMNRTEDELSDLTAEPAGGAEAHRRPITDVGTWLESVDGGVRPALRALGELLVGVAEHSGAEKPENADQFTARCLGVAGCGQLVDEERGLNPLSWFTVALALAEWIDKYARVCQVGPGEYADPPRWTQTRIGGQDYRHPLCLRVYFPAGTLLDDAGCVIALQGRQSHAAVGRCERLRGAGQPGPRPRAFGRAR